ncbi:MAG: sodium dependent transporter [Gammaproteobacteria bacterium]|nr:sodium dependent transporter [Gammaproteobacteria bacterium]
MDNGILLKFVTLTIFTLMLTIGVNHSLEHLGSVWRQRDVLLRALLAVIVLVPLVVIVLLWVFDLPPAVATGLAVLAAAPGAPLTHKRSQMAGADLTYVASLQLTLALLAVVVTPLTLAIFYGLFELDIERVSALKVAQQVAQVTFLPVIIGLALQRFAPQLVAVIGKPLNVIADALFMLLMLALIVLLVIAPDMRAMLKVGWPAIAAILIMVVAALAIGHGLGGPAQDRRSALAVASIARNVGLALFVVGLSDAGHTSIPTIVTYMILGAVIAVPYAIWSKRQVQSATTE